MFIEVSHTYSGNKSEPRLINVDHIIEVEAHEGGGVRIRFVTGTITHFDQSYAEVRRMIDNAPPPLPRM